LVMLKVKMEDGIAAEGTLGDLYHLIYQD
jgi:hypothetical protein